jgi:hypothetical protein
MNVSKLLIVLALPLSFTAAALAGEVSGTDKPNAAAAEGPVSRAEVLADLQIWHASGMADLDNGEVGMAYTPVHDAVLARYEALRAAPSFAALVHRIAQRLGDKVVLAAAQ